MPSISPALPRRQTPATTDRINPRLVQSRWDYLRYRFGRLFTTHRTILASLSVFSLLLLTVLLVVTLVHPSHSTSTPSAKFDSKMTSVQSESSLADLQATYQTLRMEPSRFDVPEADGVPAVGDQPWNKDVDDFDGPKHQVMQSLADLVPVGSTVEHVESVMGDADEMTSDLMNPFQSPGFMPGPMVPDQPGGEAQNTVYMLYYWRGRHDFLWYQLDTKESARVVKKDWFYTQEK